MTGPFHRGRLRRAWLGALAALGLAAGLLGAPGAERAAGAVGEADYPPLYSACTGAAGESAGFADAVGSFAEEEINCIFHYGITRGRTATRFSTGETISRWQMALFLARGARAAGIVLPAEPREQGFDDIGGLSREARWAVNALSGAGIMPGVSRFTFSPNAGVTRASMALLLDNFLTAAVIGEGGTDPEEITPDDDAFTDIDRVTVATYNAIRRMYELGVTTGMTETRFVPAGLVTRAQMAAFIARALSHTAARPAGLSLQASSDEVAGSEGSVELLVSVRDGNHQPVVDAIVDLFYASEPGRAFRSDGTCNAGQVISVDGSFPCEIDFGDSLTDELGDVAAITYAPLSATTLWAWTGRLQDRFDEDSADAQSLEIGYIPAPAQVLVLDDLSPNQEKLQLGDTATFTLQVADADGEPVPERDWEVTATSASVNVNGDLTSSTRTYQTDGEGQIRFSHRMTGTSAAGETAVAWLQLGPTATRPGQPALPLADETTNGRVPDDAVVPDGPDEDDLPDPDPHRGRYVARWSEEPSQPQTLSVEQRSQFTAASDDGAGAPNSVTALLTDQYGVPIRGKRILFFSDDPRGLGGDPEGEVRYRRTTNRRGESVLSYARDEDEGGIEAIWAVYEEVVGTADDAEDRPEGDGDDISLTAERIYHYWAETPGAGAVTGRILEKDPAGNRLVAAAAEKVLLAEYDNNDQFTSVSGRPVTLAEFEKELAATDEDEVAHLTVEFYSETAGRVSSFTAGEEWHSILPPDDDFTSYVAGEPVPRRLPGGSPGTAVAVDQGVVVIGVPYADLKDLDHDRDPDTADQCPDWCGDAGLVMVYNSIDDRLPQTLTAPTPTAHAMFGTDVDIAGDTIVVGEPGDEWGDGRYEGAAYVFVRNSVSGKWEHKGRLSDDNAGPGVTFSTDPALGTDDYDRMFGRSVAVSGDGSTVAVAVPYEDRIGRTSDPMTDRGRAGAVYLYAEPVDGWAASQTPTFTLLPAAAADEGPGMNKNLAISHDGTEVALGASLAADRRGRVYVFQTDSVATWNEPSATPTARPTHPSDAVLTAPADGANFVFGRRVGFDKAGDTLVIGSGSEDRAGGGHPGKIYVAEDDDWTSAAGRTMAVLRAAAPRIPDQFSQYVSINPQGTEVAGSRHERQEGGQRGSAVLFKRDGATWTVENAAGERGSVGETQIGIDEEFLGAAPGDRLGWETTFDRTTGALYSSTRRDDPGGFHRFRLYQIQR